MWDELPASVKSDASQAEDVRRPLFLLWDVEILAQPAGKEDGTRRKLVGPQLSVIPLFSS